MTESAFAKRGYEFTRDDGRALLLEQPEEASAEAVALAICRLDPWLTLKTRPEHVSTLLLREDPHCHRWIIRDNGAAAGVVVVRSPWLFGPYLNLLAILPDYQSLGIGSAILRWMADEVAGSAGNLWVCASEFNARATAFYERHGFDRVGALPDLVAPDFSEILLRKRLAA